jgi:tetratricopeptide (TPR) repeat protein
MVAPVDLAEDDPNQAATLRSTTGERALMRFRTGAVLQGRLLRELLDETGLGPPLPEGARIGPWRIKELLGSGGMSHVYLAERADEQFEQQVALKQVRGNPALSSRLRHERQVLAGLRHPNIVGLVDGGETPQGDLWFAMALVEGDTLDQFIRSRQPGWRERLQLFDGLCAAVEYAHGRGLIHRDIKPANILVDDAGHPRLLDFGIALAESEAAGSEDRALTPAFASPEQLAGQELSVRSDVFQLGLVLDGLMRGQTGTDWIALPAALGRDLRLVQRIATADDPAARYPTAAALRADLSRLLARRPLASQQDQFGPRCARAIERNRLTVAVGSFALLALVLSLSVAAWRLAQERNQALANERHAKAVAGFLVETLNQASPYAAGGGSVSVAEAMDLAAQRLDEQLAESPELRRELRSTIGGVYLSLDEAKRCLGLFDTPQADLELVAAPSEQRARAQILRSECHLALDERGPAGDWLDAAWQSLEGQEGPAVDALRAFILVDRAQLLLLSDRLSESNAVLEQALALARSSGSLEQEYRASRFLGGNLQNAGEHERALAYQQRALALARQAYGAVHRSTLTTAGGLAITQARLQRWDEAEQTMREALDAADSIRHRGAAPDIVIAQLRDNYANILWQQERFAECIEQADAALALYRRSAPESSSQGFNPSWRVATCAYQNADLAQARRYAEIALGYARDKVPVGVVNVQRMLAAIAAREGNAAEARARLAEAQAALKAAEISNPSVLPALQLARARLAVLEDDLSAARAALHSANQDIERWTSPSTWLIQERDEVERLLEPAPAEVKAGAD